MKKIIKNFVRRIILTIFIIGFLFAILYLGFIEKKANADSKRDYVVYNVEKIPRTLNNLPNSDLVQEDILYLLFDGLVMEDENGRIIPQLSDGWEILEEGLTYSFNIRENAYWSNGDKITAEDFKVFFLNLLRDNSLEYKDELFNVKGARDYARGKVGANSVGISTKDENVLIFNLYFPDENFINILSSPCFLVRKDFDKLNVWKKNYKDILYSGAFKIKSSLGSNQIIMSRNKQYWDIDKIKCKEIHIKKDNMEEAYGDYIISSIDIMRGVPESEQKLLINSEELMEVETQAEVLFVYNVNEGKILRNYDNREKLDNLIQSSFQDESDNVELVFSINNHENNTVSEEDENVSLDNKKIVLLQFIDGTSYINSEKHKSEYKELIGKLQKNDIDVVSKIVATREELKDELLKGEFDVFITENVIKEDTKTFFVKWMNDSIYNVFGFDDNLYNEAVLEYITSENYNEKYESIKKAEKILKKDMIYSQLDYGNIIVCRKGYLRGLQTNIRGNLYLKHAFIDN